MKQSTLSTSLGIDIQKYPPKTPRIMFDQLSGHSVGQPGRLTHKMYYPRQESTTLIGVELLTGQGSQCTLLWIWEFSGRWFRC